MANREHLRPLLEAVASGDCRSWNYWRIDHPSVLPDLMGVELREVRLSFADFSNTDLSRANLSGTNLHHANLRKTDLSRATLRNVDLSEADLSCANLMHSDLSRSNLRDAVLRNADLSQADFSDADLSNADLSGSNLSAANLSGANLEGACLIDTVLRPDIQPKQENWLDSGISRLEKAALGMIRSKGVKRRRSRVLRAVSFSLQKSRNA